VGLIIVFAGCANKQRIIQPPVTSTVSMNKENIENITAQEAVIDKNLKENKAAKKSKIVKKNNAGAVAENNLLLEKQKKEYELKIAEENRQKIERDKIRKEKQAKLKVVVVIIAIAFILAISCIVFYISKKKKNLREEKIQEILMRKGGDKKDV